MINWLLYRVLKRKVPESKLIDPILLNIYEVEVTDDNGNKITEIFKEHFCIDFFDNNTGDTYYRVIDISQKIREYLLPKRTMVIKEEGATMEGGGTARRLNATEVTWKKIGDYLDYSPRVPNYLKKQVVLEDNSKELR